MFREFIKKISRHTMVNSFLEESIVLMYISVKEPTEEHTFISNLLKEQFYYDPFGQYIQPYKTFYKYYINCITNNKRRKY